MKKYKLIDTSEQTVFYECEIEANSLEEAEKKAEKGYDCNWKEVNNWCNSNEISVKEIKDEVSYDNN